MKNYRADFPILQEKFYGQTLVYFDNAATSQKPIIVIDAVSDFYKKYNSNVHRSINPLGEKATAAYEDSRKTIAQFLGAKTEEIIFTRNATEGVNLVAKTWGRKFLKPGDRVVLSIAEHHSNIVPWLQLKAERGIELDFIPLTPDQDLDVDKAKGFLNNRKVKLLALTHASNVLGTYFPVAELLVLARKNNITTLLDAAQSIAHGPVEVKKLGCDFLVFSGHKVYGPTGIGVLYGRRELLEVMPEFLGGGEMIHEVTAEGFSSKEVPYKYEAGTPHIAGAIGLAAAVRYLQSIGWSTIVAQEKDLADYLLAKIQALRFVNILGPKFSSGRLPLVSFTMPIIHPHDIADLLGEAGICIRAGHHCAQPLHRALGLQSSARASLAFYNTEDEIDGFIQALEKINHRFSKS